MMNTITWILLKLMAFLFNRRAKFNKYLESSTGYINFIIGFKTEKGNMNRALCFHEGRVSVLKQIPESCDATLRFKDNSTVFEMLRITPNEMLTLILNNRMIFDGNIAFLQAFNFYISLLMSNMHRKKLKKVLKKEKKLKKKLAGSQKKTLTPENPVDESTPLKGIPDDPGVLFLDEPYLSQYSLKDFPRLEWMLDRHFTVKPQVCPERPLLLTRWHQKHGFEKDSNGKKWNPELRQAEAFHYLMTERKPLIPERGLLAGTTTSKEPTGVVIYPDAQGTMLWGELKSVSHRPLNPYDISDQDADILHKEVFPYWTSRNFREYVRQGFNHPDSLKIDERWVYYFVWKSVGISHTIPDYPAILSKGTGGIINEIDAEIKKRPADDTGSINSLKAMKRTLEALNAYAVNLSVEARDQAVKEVDEKRKKELNNIANILKKVPSSPASTLYEALQVIWIVWVALHSENTNTGLSMGRLDQWLQPYLLNDMKTISSPEEREAYVREAIELCGSLFMCGTDHLPLVPDIGNYLFGGSSSDQAITLGGTDPGGADGVNDMTYILLKVTELLAVRDPNVNARFSPGVNSDTYLKRLCEINYTTKATPSMHNDDAVFEALAGKGFAENDTRDWSATGCVEPTISGKHMGHTGSILMNMVAALEMALNNGTHPHMSESFGPETGSIEQGDFSTFDDFFEAYCMQQQFLIKKAVELNYMYGEAHANLRPTPFLSSIIDGSIEKARDVTKGGSRYNTSGTSNIGLADVTDSMMVIKKLVYDKKLITFQRLKKAIDSNFVNDQAAAAVIKKEVPFFGSGSPEALAMANRITSFLHDEYDSHTNYRGGPYRTGFWSMSQHVAYGNLSGTLPSGRIEGKAFTPGLTPHPGASSNFLDNIRDVARLAPENMDNNIAFNVKIIPGFSDDRETVVNHMTSYVKTYFELGGMQMQFNVMNSNTLRDAMVNPEKYQNLLVRISGYNAYFVTLNREMQLELIERAEYGI